jgi:hypothetical protein
MQLLFLLLPLIAASFVFATRNWLNSTICIQNIYHYLFNGIALLKSREWAEPYTMCLDPYWVNQWLKNYGAGFTKRGLLGELATHFFGGRINLLSLNLLSFLFLILISLGIVALLTEIGSRKSLAQAAIFTSLIWLTPFGKSLSETAGDPLHIVVLLTIVSIMVIRLFSLNGNKRDFCLALTFCLSILIHEGAFLLALPVYLLLGRRSWIWWSGMALALAFTLGFSSADQIESQSLITNRLFGFNPLNKLELAYRSGGSIASQVSFSSNLNMEMARYVANPVGVAAEVYRTLVVTLFLSCSFTAWIQAYNKAAANYFIRSWWLWLPISLPFFLVTHDWIRYGVINIILCLCVTACRFSTHDPAREPGNYMPLNSDDKIRLGCLAALLVLSIVIGPYFNQVDIRTNPVSQLGTKYTLVCLAGLALIRYQKKPLATAT